MHLDFFLSITWVFKDLLVAWRWAVLMKERVERLKQTVNTFCFILPTPEFSFCVFNYSYTTFPDWDRFKWVLLFLLSFIETVSCCVIKTNFNLTFYHPGSGMVGMWQHAWVIARLCILGNRLEIFSLFFFLWFSLVLILFSYSFNIDYS